MPQEFKGAPIIPLFKGKGNKYKPTDNRGISLLNCAGKILAPKLLKQLHNEVLESIIPEQQCRFRSERKTIDLIYIARQIQEVPKTLPTNVHIVRGHIEGV